MTEQDPWIHLPADYRVNYLGEVIALACTLALRAPGKASLCGYHRPAFEKRGAWPQVVDQLEDEWKPPPPGSTLFRRL